MTELFNPELEILLVDSLDGLRRKLVDDWSCSTIDVEIGADDRGDIRCNVTDILYRIDLSNRSNGCLCLLAMTINEFKIAFVALFFFQFLGLGQLAIILLPCKM